jgi:hypothetical protein
MGGYAGDVELACAVLEEDQGVHPAQIDQVDVDEVAGDDALGLRGQELAPRRPAAARAGSMPAAVKISQTVVAPIECPRRTGSPWIRRQPHRGFSWASRSTNAFTARAVGGLPGLLRRLL